MRAFLVVVGLAVAAAGCVLDDLDYEGRPCPCADGWHCAERADGDICVRQLVDGGAPDAPLADVPTTDAGEDTCPADVRFCDGFEDGDAFVGAGPWDLTVAASGRGAVEATADAKHLGSWSLWARTLMDGEKAAAVAQDPDPLTEGELWARAWVYVPSGQDIQGVIPLSVGNALTGWVHVLLGPDDLPVLVVGAQGEAVDSYPAGTIFPRDEWFCLRLEVSMGDGTAGSARLHLGPDAVAFGSGIDTLPPGGYTSVIAGIGFSLPAQPPMELYVDDVVVDTREVGCN